MKATEMWDLLRDARKALAMVGDGLYHNGQNQFKHIRYCRLCSYSQAHGHGDNCIITKINAAFETEVTSE